MRLKAAMLHVLYGVETSSVTFREDSCFVSAGEQLSDENIWS
jgi:hypothetical protein